MQYNMNNELRKKIENPDKYLSKLELNKKVILDLGCGSGFYCMFLKEYASKLYCIDIDKEALDEAKKDIHGNNIIFLNEDAKKISLADSSIDVVFLANSFHDIEDKEKAYLEIKRVLKKDGKIIIIDWKKVTTEFGPPMSIRMSEKDYLSRFKDFKIYKEFQPTSTHHFGLVLIWKK